LEASRNTINIPFNGSDSGVYIFVTLIGLMYFMGYILNRISHELMLSSITDADKIGNNQRYKDLGTKPQKVVVIIT